MRRLPFSLATALLLAAVLVLPANAARRSPSEARPADAGSEHARVVAYWTPQRRATAVPREVLLPAAKPDNPGGGKGKGGGGGGDTTDPTLVTGATWRGGGDVAWTTGKVYFTLGGTRYVCSGSAVDSSQGSVVLTAGHCTYGVSEGFATNWIFYPAYDGGPSSLGAWTATDLFTTTAWASSEDLDDDAGFAVVTNGTSTTLEAALAGVGAAAPAVAFDGFDLGLDYHAFGYPAAKKYKGTTLTYCAGPTLHSYDGRDTLSLECDMTGGSSGGPWYRDFDGAHVVNSLNSYGYASLKRMFGPVFGAAENSAFGATGAGDCPAATPTCSDLSD